MLRTKVQNEVLQRKVDSSSDETRSEDKAADLEFEAGLAPRVAVHNNAADVSSAFEKGANTECESIGPCFGHDTNDDGRDEAYPKQSAQEGVGAHVRIVSIESCVDWAIGGDFEALSEIALWASCGGFNDEELEGEGEADQDGRSGEGRHGGARRDRYQVRSIKIGRPEEE